MISSHPLLPRSCVPSSPPTQSVETTVISMQYTAWCIEVYMIMFNNSFFADRLPHFDDFQLYFPQFRSTLTSQAKHGSYRTLDYFAWEKRWSLQMVKMPAYFPGFAVPEVSMINVLMIILIKHFTSHLFWSDIWSGTHISLDTRKGEKRGSSTAAAVKRRKHYQ